MRNTKQKSLILDIIDNSCNHPTAYEIYQECIKTLPNISLGTVYRNLNTLINLDKIQRIDNLNGITRYDKIICHDHFICNKCGSIYDVERNKITYDDIINGNKVYACKISYEGICHDCLNKYEGDE